VIATLPLLFTSVSTLFWLSFFYYYSPRFTTPRRVLVVMFFGGMAVAAIAAWVELTLLEALPLLRALALRVFAPESGQDVLQIAALSFLFVAPVEEIVKFVLLRIAIFNTRYFNQIIDGLKIGLAVGLGFATFENWLVFTRSAPEGLSPDALALFLLRMFGSTLAHALYGAVLGYYIGHARSSKLWGSSFLMRGLVTSVLMHGFFNSFIFLNLGAFSLFIIFGALLVFFHWYTDREHLLRVSAGPAPEKITTPHFSERRELENTLLRSFPARILLASNLCPRCFRRVARIDALCPYCRLNLWMLKGEQQNTSRELHKTLRK